MGNMGFRLITDIFFLLMIMLSMSMTVNLVMDSLINFVLYYHCFCAIDNISMRVWMRLLSLTHHFNDSNLFTLIKDIYVLKGLVELLDDSHLLVIKLDFMFAYNIQESVRRQAAQVLLIAWMLILDDTKHPQDGMRVDNLLLTRIVPAIIRDIYLFYIWSSFELLSFLRRFLRRVLNFWAFLINIDVELNDFE